MGLVSGMVRDLRSEEASPNARDSITGKSSKAN